MLLQNLRAIPMARAQEVIKAAGREKEYAEVFNSLVQAQAKAEENQQQAKPRDQAMLSNPMEGLSAKQLQGFAEKARKDNDPSSAVVYLTEALRIEPNNPTIKDALAGAKFGVRGLGREVADATASIKEPAYFTEVNIGGFANMLKAAVDNNIKQFVYASSSSVYGDEPT